MMLALPDAVTIDKDDAGAFAAYQAAVGAELEKLLPLGNYQKRRATVWQLAWAAVTPQVSQNSVFERPDVVSKTIFVKKWSKQGEFAAVLERVTQLTRAYVEGKDGRALERRRATLRDLEEQVALQIMSKAQNMLNFPLQTAVTSSKEEVDAEGRRVVHTTVIEPSDKWRIPDAARMAKEASTLGRRALDMTKDKNELEIDLSQLSDEELDALANGL